MSREAMKLALEALNTTESDCGSRAWEREQEAITALREALAEQPAPMIRGDIRDGLVDDEPAQRKPQQDCTRSHPHENMDAMCELRTEIARLANENARLKAQPQQEPVAYAVTGKLGGICSFHSMEVKKGDLVWSAKPAQRKPLTEEEILDANWVGNKAHITACPAPTAEGLIAFARAIEAAHGIKENT